MQIEANELGFAYRSRQKVVPAIEAVTFSIARGEFVAVIGPSGCGKTTLLKIVAGLLKPTSGKITIDGSPAEDASSKRRVGFSFQSALLLPWRTTLQNVLLPIEILKEQGADVKLNPKDTAEALLNRVGLKGFAESYPSELSGGMRQRAALARTLVYNPDVLLMDEPFGALDGITREKMQFLLLGIWHESKRTVLFVTHDITEAIFVADRVIVLSERPATVVADVAIEIERPRERNAKLTKKFLKYEELLWGYLGET